MKIAHYNKMLPDCLLDIHSPPYLLTNKSNKDNIKGELSNDILLGRRGF